MDGSVNSCATSPVLTVSALRAEIELIATRAGLDADQRGDLALVVSELATNGLVHGRDPVMVSVEITTDAVVVLVWDSMVVPLPDPRTFGRGDETGRGLAIVGQLANVSWGLAGDRKYVRAVMPIPRRTWVEMFIAVELRPLARPHKEALAS
ncbi:ATP-binding protein [Embleya sp. AB8]|uniref:ATP-binding protein n=1 Tax=Embleya sp. AB8 TaxID=3156304 RepID=UPI003C761B59